MAAWMARQCGTRFGCPTLKPRRADLMPENRLLAMKP